MFDTSRWGFWPGTQWTLHDQRANDEMRKVYALVNRVTSTYSQLASVVAKVRSRNATLIRHLRQIHWYTLRIGDRQSVNSTHCTQLSSVHYWSGEATSAASTIAVKGRSEFRLIPCDRLKSSRIKANFKLTDVIWRIFRVKILLSVSCATPNRRLNAMDEINQYCCFIDNIPPFTKSHSC